LYIIDAIKQIVVNADEWGKNYIYDKHTNEFHHSGFSGENVPGYSNWFDLS
jgi:hypothetical protein